MYYFTTNCIIFTTAFSLHNDRYETKLPEISNLCLLVSEAVTSYPGGIFIFMQKESSIQSKIKQTLERQGWLVVKCIQMSLNGWPDLQIHKDGITKFVEVKQPGKKPTDLQLYRHNQLRKQGFEVITATSIEDLQ